MRIKVQDIIKTLAVDISGVEDWLSEIYNTFPVPSKFAEQQDVPRLSGQLQLEKMSSNVVRVRGSLDYAPFVACSRCDDSIQWPISTQIDTIYRPAPEEEVENNVHDVHAADLDDYFIIGGEIDLELLVNDSIHLALPSKLIKSSEDGRLCSVCGIDLTSDKVCSAGDAVKESPFRNLQQMIDNFKPS